MLSLIPGMILTQESFMGHSNVPSQAKGGWKPNDSGHITDAGGDQYHSDAGEDAGDVGEDDGDVD